MKAIYSLLLIMIVSCTFSQQKNGSWVSKTYSATGDWSVQKEGDSLYLTIEKNFKTSSGPDLKLYLSKSEIEKIGNRESVDKDGVFISELKSSKGYQKYLLPSNIKISDYKSIVILCRKYSVVWTGVNLHPSADK